jgi:hypothetical protein
MIEKYSELLNAVDLIESNLDAAHIIAQTHEGDPLGDTIHAIIHRREGDLSNSLYWWRRVGDQVPHQLLEVYPERNPSKFVRDLSLSSEKAINIASIEKAELDSLRSILASKMEG